MDFLFNPLTLVTFFPLVGVLVILFLEVGTQGHYPLGGVVHLVDHLWSFHLGVGSL